MIAIVVGIAAAAGGATLPEGYIIDCEGLALGFWFSGEGRGSVLDGFTIANGLGAAPGPPETMDPT